MPLTSAYDVKHTIYNQIITVRSENLQYFFMFNHKKKNRTRFSHAFYNYMEKRQTATRTSHRHKPVIFESFTVITGNSLYSGLPNGKCKCPER